MKDIGIIVNRGKDPDLSFTGRLVEWLKSRDCVPELLTGGEDCDAKYGRFDFLICLGGDGTMLKAAGGAALGGVPLIGVNLGDMGYLTDATRSEAVKALDKVLRGNYKLEKRMMLEADLSGYGITAVSPALNEICVARGVRSKLIQIKLWINDEYIDEYRCDGIIVSTPTGSTAYNLSAGGPILKPDANMIAVTPICSHALYTRPFVVSADDAVQMQLGGALDTCDASVLTDGKHVVNLNAGDKIEIKRSEYFSTIIKTNEYGFYDILRQKMLPPNR